MFFTIPYPPTATNLCPRARQRKRAYTEKVQQILSKCNPIDGDVYVSVRFFPENYYHQPGDIDNLMKVLLDALKGRCFYDDKQVRAIYAVMMDSAPGNSRAELRVEKHLTPAKMHHKYNWGNKK